MVRQPKNYTSSEETLTERREFSKAEYRSASDADSSSGSNGSLTQKQPVSHKAAAAKKGRKKRNVVNNRISLYMVCIFFVFMMALAVLLVVLPRPVTSGIERRNLAAWPSFSAGAWLSGDYTGGITLFYDDTVPARDTFKNISNNIKSAFGISSSNTVEVIGTVSRMTDKNAVSETDEVPDETKAEIPSETADAPEQETTAAPQEKERPVRDYHKEDVETINEDGIIVAFQDGHWRAMSLYGYYYDSLYNDVVNYIRQVVDPDVNVYFMPIPTAVQFYCPPDYMDYTANMEDVYREVTSQMISKVQCIDMIPVLNEHNEEDIYLRTDHHWSSLGAYYAAKNFAETVNLPFRDLSDYTQYINEGYVGTMYAYSQSANLLNDPEDFVYYVPTNAYTVDYYDTAFNYLWTAGLFVDTDVDNSYSTYMGGDSRIVKVTTDAANGRRAVIIKDSFANAMIPFLTSSFEEIYVVDQRYFDVNLVNFIAYNNITDILFANSYFSLIGAEAELLEYITYSNYDMAISDDAPEAQLPDRDS